MKCFSLKTGLVVAMIGCASTDVGNPITTEITFAGYDGSGPQPTGLVLDTGVTIESAYLKVRSFKLDRSDECDAVDSNFDGVVLVDLIEQSLSDVPLWEDEAGTFCRLRLQFTTDSAEGQPEGLDGASLYVRGTGPEGDTFTLSLTAEPTLSLAGPFTLPEGSHLLQVGFFLGEWFAGIDPTSLSGEVDITQTDFTNRVVTSARLFHDANQDGLLDTQEIATSLAFGE